MLISTSVGDYQCSVSRARTGFPVDGPYSCLLNNGSGLVMTACHTRRRRKRREVRYLVVDVDGGACRGSEQPDGLRSAEARLTAACARGRRARRREYPPSNRPNPLNLPRGSCTVRCVTGNLFRSVFYSGGLGRYPVSRPSFFCYRYYDAPAMKPLWEVMWPACCGSVPSGDLRGESRMSV